MSAMRKKATATTSGRTSSSPNSTLAFLTPNPTSTLAKIAIAAIRIHAVPPRCLRVTLRIQYVVHARDDQGRDRRRLRESGNLDCGPQFGLQPGGPVVDLSELLLVASGVEQDALLEIAPEQ